MRNASRDDDREAVFRAGLYARISEEVSGSTIDNQFAVMEEYISGRREIREAGRYADIGVSGASFNRPQYLRLMEDVREGRINCIIVKDLSRLGRSMWETGFFMEMILPEIGCRLISVADGYDSSRAGIDFNSLILNMMNAYYLRDVGTKIRSSLIARSLSGSEVAQAPYGYDARRNKEGIRTYVPNPEQAAVVRRIFAEFLAGKSFLSIARNLTRESVPRPKDIKSVKNPPEPGKWSDVTIRSILSNEAYVGAYRYGIKKCVRSETGTVHKKPASPENVIRIENAHEPIVDEDTFRAAAILIKSRSRPFKKKNGPARHVLAGRVRCGKCGKTMRVFTGQGGFVYMKCMADDDFFTGCCHIRKITCRRLMGEVTESLVRKTEDFAAWMENEQTKKKKEAEERDREIARLRGVLFSLWRAGMALAQSDLPSEEKAKKMRIIREETRTCDVNLSILEKKHPVSAETRVSALERLRAVKEPEDLTEHIIDAFIEIMTLRDDTGLEMVFADGSREVIEWKRFTLRRCM